MTSDILKKNPQKGIYTQKKQPNKWADSSGSLISF